MADKIAERVAERFAAAPMPEEKFKELLLKIRKGATASLTVKKWVEVLTRLGGGWKIEPTVGFVTTRGYETTNSSPQHVFAYSREDAEAQHARLKAIEVFRKPTSPKLGQKYVMDLSEVQQAKSGSWYIEYNEFIGAAGLLFTSPEGQGFELGANPGKVEKGDLKTMSTAPLERWLKTTKLTEQVANYLGMDTVAEQREKAKPKTRSGSGTCPCCFRNIKLKARSNGDPTIVLHGYQRPGWGQIQGSCFGVNYAPFELSCEGTKHLVSILEGQEQQYGDFYRRLKGGQIVEIIVQRHKMVRKVTPADADWQETYERKVRETESMLEQLKSDIKVLKKLISEWKLQPLPEEGGKINPPPVQFR